LTVGGLEEQYERFLGLLTEEDKEGAIHYALDLLEREEVDVAALYERILAPALKNMSCSLKEKQWCIWKEHMRTSIVRTIIESCHPYVMKERRSRPGAKGMGRVVLVCPTEEYHELGIRMVADMFTMAGYDVALIGANTPFADIVSAAEYFHPKVLGISATSSYALFAAGRAIKKLREKFPNKEVLIIVGGVAFESNPNAWMEIGADAHLSSFADILALGGS
jgi:MerR family transcriptional regulator, light-induced transcriptional regulator